MSVETDGQPEMTAPTSPSPDSLAAVVAELRNVGLFTWADRIERLDAEMRKEVDRRNGWLAECYRISGADPSGGMKGDVNEDWRLAQNAVEAVTDLRRDYDEACNEAHDLSAKLAACGWQPIEQSQPERDSWAIYWHISEDGGFPDIAHEWRDEDHRRYASHWLPYKPPALASRTAHNDISTPRPTDCADIREGRVTVLARDQNGEACMTMVPIHPWQGVGAVNQEEPPR